MTNASKEPSDMKEPVLTSKIMHRPVVPLQVTFPCVQTLSLQFSDIEDQWVGRKAAAPSVAVLMKEAIAQHMGPSVISVEAITISKQFVILD